MTPTEVGILLRALARVLADSEQTTEIHTAEELTGRGLYSRLAQRFRTDSLGKALLERRPELCEEQVDYPALRKLPKGSLGREYVDHLDSNGLSAATQALPVTHAKDPDVAYLMRRYRQTHDVWHPLLGLGVLPHEEVMVHAFSYGQLKLPVSAMVLFFGGIKHHWGEGRFRYATSGVLAGVECGKIADPLLGVIWEDHWEEDIRSVRNRYRIFVPDWFRYEQANLGGLVRGNSTR